MANRSPFDSNDRWIDRVADDSEILKKSWTTAHLESALSPPPEPPPSLPAESSDD